MEMLWKEDLKSYFTFHNKDMAVTVCLLATGFTFKHSVIVHTVSVTKHFSISTIYVCDISANQMFDCSSVCLSWYPILNLSYKFPCLRVFFSSSASLCSSWKGGLITKTKMTASDLTHVAITETRTQMEWSFLLVFVSIQGTLQPNLECAHTSQQFWQK